jgi:hypothetical protein
MQIIYQKQIPGKPPKQTVIQGWIAALVGSLILLGVLVLLILLIPAMIIAMLGFFAFVIFLLISGWIYLAYRIGFRDMWDITKLFFGIGNARIPWDERRKRVMKEWEDRGKGRSGMWVK